MITMKTYAERAARYDAAHPGRLARLRDIATQQTALAATRAVPRSAVVLVAFTAKGIARKIAVQRAAGYTLVGNAVQSDTCFSATLTKGRMTRPPAPGEHRAAKGRPVRTRFRLQLVPDPG